MRELAEQRDVEERRVRREVVERGVGLVEPDRDAGREGEREEHPREDLAQEVALDDDVGAERGICFELGRHEPGSFREGWRCDCDCSARPEPIRRLGWRLRSAPRRSRRRARRSRSAALAPSSAAWRRAIASPRPTPRPSVPRPVTNGSAARARTFAGKAGALVAHGDRRARRSAA